MRVKIGRISYQRGLDVFANVFFFLLFVLASYFYKERMLCYDPAFFSFNIIHDLDFYPVLGRWGSVFSQILPVIFANYGADVKTILWSYSVSFILLYYLFYLIIRYVYKDNRAVMVLLLALCLTFRSTFYYATAELYQALAISVIFGCSYGRWLKQQKLLASQFWVSVALVIGVSFYHQASVFPILFFIGWFWLENGLQHYKKPTLMLGLTLLWFVVRIKLLTVSTYEQGKLLGSSEYIAMLKNIWDLPSTEYLFGYLVNDQFVPGFVLKELVLPVFLLAVVVTAMLAKRAYWLAGFTALFTLGFALVVVLTLGTGESAIMYENYMSLYGLFIGLPLVFMMLKTTSKKLVLAVVALLCITSLVNIKSKGGLFTQRVQYVTNMVEYGKQFKQDKFILYPSNVPEELVGATWSFPFETLLASALDGPAHSESFFMDYQGNLDPVLQKRSSNFLGPAWEPYWFTTSSFDVAHFHLDHYPYREVNTSQDSMRNYETDFSPENVKLHILDHHIDRRTSFVNVLIQNHSNHPMLSKPGEDIKVNLSYHTYDADNKLIAWDNKRATLHADIPAGKQLTQTVVLGALPDHVARIDIDLVTEGVRWWGLKAKGINVTD